MLIYILAAVFTLQVTLSFDFVIKVHQKPRKKETERKQKRKKTEVPSRREVTNQLSGIIHELFDSMMLTDFRKVVKEISSVLIDAVWRK